MACSNADYTICIVHPGWNAYTETFIQAHIDRLPGQVQVLRGDWFYNRRSTPVVYPALFYLLKVFRFTAGKSSWLSRITERTALIVETLALKRFLQRRKVDVVLAEYGPMGVHIMQASAQAGLPLVVHFHGNDAYDQGTLERHASNYRRLFLLAHSIIVVSRDMQEQLIALGAPPDKLIYNPYGIDPALFRQTNPAANPPTFVTAGRFVDKKAPYLTLLAFREVVRAFPQAKLVMIGEGSLREACWHLAQALNIDQSVEFAGALPHSEVAVRMQGARTFVQHSLRTTYGDSEGTPLAILEAGMSGLPVVSTHHAGIKDVVIEGETGFLVDEHDLPGMAEHMIRLAGDAELAAKIGRKAREHIVAHFSMERHIGELGVTLEQAAASKNA